MLKKIIIAIPVILVVAAGQCIWTQLIGPTQLLIFAIAPAMAIGLYLGVEWLTGVRKDAEERLHAQIGELNRQHTNLNRDVFREIRALAAEVAELRRDDDL
jgi:hypothetical protein